MRKGKLIIALLAAAFTLFAQDSKEERRQLRIEEYTERLNLTPNQTAELKELRESLKPELKAIKMDPSKSRSEKMRAHADVIEKRENEIAQILTAEQMAELKRIKSERKEMFQQRKRN
ncbi:MAG: hypothetical protein HRT61_24315 [Ekhidna sp.]|nr:hypothetical protein [Ekhidna sp.]